MGKGLGPLVELLQAATPSGDPHNVGIVLVADEAYRSDGGEARRIIRIVPVGSDTDGPFVSLNVTIVILTATGEMRQIPNCGTLDEATLPLYDAVLINLDANPRFGIPIVTPFQVGLATPLPPGTRLENASADGSECCHDENNIIIADCCSGIDPHDDSQRDLRGVPGQPGALEHDDAGRPDDGRIDPVDTRERSLPGRSHSHLLHVGLQGVEGSGHGFRHAAASTQARSRATARWHVAEAASR